MAKGNVVIIGFGSAGVIGLSCAVQLARDGHQITVIARELPGDYDIDYASPWAGSHFRPVPATKPEDRLELELMRETYRQLQDLADRHPEAGIQFIPAVEYFDTADPAYFDETLIQENGYASWPGFRVLSSSELPVQCGSVKLGVTYTAWVLNSPVYLKWLKAVAMEYGVSFIRANLAATEEAVFLGRERLSGSGSDEVVAVINASGRGFNDPKSFPSRGQFIVVSNLCGKTINHHWADGSTTVIIPRPLGGGTIIGGTKEPRNWSVGNCLDKNHGLDIRQVYIGRRPMRQGGLRLEREDLAFQDTSENGMSNVQKFVPVIHCYGAGPSGFKLSWGIAKRVERFVSEI
ncbi:hypothetical protein ASPCADRAFT_399474 [Aspergillus carbonarius ITEM 5010]|uniref:FAD dependent oxidoreductase domain-containing protein n=1 Tax=Aspergillus carbonarius (strain ITEM 5010) TaxID=602072 RepID=A0A1R3RC96_ASPC5|nr:hypothetical protein ASPCADRAFT_399474 [Aspergillus carbonarius ITEM 5010]